ncbi:transmembrane [Cystoisospora suis]|uniref:Transmembrane n=1 Tax=Cystoisospora suis TaxID=483139 RepID=A0A2C6KMA8_9APIC|nr:transmembrane [Cystoisospora suis]
MNSSACRGALEDEQAITTVKSVSPEQSHCRRIREISSHPRAAWAAFLQQLLSAKVMRWREAEELYKGLQNGCVSRDSQLPSFRDFFEECAEVITPATGLSLRKFFWDGSGPEHAWLALTSEAEDDFSSGLKMLKVLARVSRSFSTQHVQVYEAVTGHLLKSRRPMSLLEWTRLCAFKGVKSAPLLRLLLESRLLEVRGLESGFDGAAGLVLGPWAFSAFRCGNANCPAQYHAECISRLLRLGGSRVSPGDRLCPECGKPWQGRSAGTEDLSQSLDVLQ